MFDTVGGIDLDPKTPAFKHILLHPTPGGSLKNVETAYDSINGKITTKWKVDGSTFNLHIDVPINTAATVSLPDGTDKQVTSGVYDFTAQVPASH
jgi:alpha-L-rhamnosidase